MTTPPNFSNPANDSLPSSTFPLSGKTALVTGASSGIGRSLAFAFARAGCYVACVSRSHPLGRVDPRNSTSPSRPSSLFALADADGTAANQTIAELINAASLPSDASTDSSSSERARDFICDVTSPYSFAQLEQDIRKWVDQPVTILVNNAGVASVAGIEFHTPDGMESWNKVIATNLTGPVALTYQFLPGMLAAGDGCIISVGSRNAVVPVPFMAAYNVSKTGLLKFHETLEKEIGGRGVRNFFVVPGNINTGILKRENSVDERSYRESERMRRMVKRINDAGKRGENAVTRAQDFADVCVRLAAMGKDADILSGRYVDTERDVEALLEDAKKGTGSEICKRRLYQLNIDRL